MSTLKELLAQRVALEKQIVSARETESSNAIQSVRAIISEYQLTERDVFGSSKKVKTSPSKVAAKYRDPATGKEWSGRGLAPKWIQGKDKTQFLIAE